MVTIGSDTYTPFSTLHFAFSITSSKLSLLSDPLKTQSPQSLLQARVDRSKFFMGGTTKWKKEFSSQIWGILQFLLHKSKKDGGPVPLQPPPVPSTLLQAHVNSKKPNDLDLRISLVKLSKSLHKIPVLYDNIILYVLWLNNIFFHVCTRYFI